MNVPRAIRCGFPVLGVALALLWPGNGIAEVTECTSIDSLPATIDSQGIYCFTQDLATLDTSGNAIEIDVNNVTIDCNGWKLGGLGGGVDTETVGIYADGRENITIRNCNIRGFRRGVDLDGGSGHVVENVRSDRNRRIGIRVSGTGSIIRNNHIVDTGDVSLSTATGIVMLGNGNEISNNLISSPVTSAGGGVGIGLAFARVFVLNNRFYDMETGIGPALAEVVYRGNIFFDVTTPCETLAGTCYDAGNNASFSTSM